ncbi:MAG: tetratricopeptide repeat protein, partial [Rikenellaceae bacterium]
MKRVLAAILFLLSVLVCSTEVSRAQYNQDYFFWLSRNQMLKDDFSGAIATLNMLLRVDEKAYEGYFLRGIAKYNLNDLIGADADFSTAISKNPVYTTAYTYRAITRSRLGNYDDALHDFEEAIELRPDIASPYFSRGVTRLLNQQFKEAIADFDKFIRYEDKVVDAYINRGFCYLQLRDTTSAFTNFDTAIRTNRENPEGYNRRGTLYMQQKRNKEAEADFDMAIRCDSTHIPALFNRALVYNETRRPLEALADLDRVIKLDSTSSLSFFNRAIVRSQIGDYNRALEDYNQVADYSPNNVLVYFYRANLLTRLGDIESAESDYTRAIELYPDFANAYIYRAELRSWLKDRTGAASDRKIAEAKIEAHKSKLQDSTYSIYSDTTYQFDKLLAFDNKLSGSSFDRVSSNKNGGDSELTLIPLYKFTFAQADTTTLPSARYYSMRVEAFIESLNNTNIQLAHRQSHITPDSLIKVDRAIASQQKESPKDWKLLFQRGISQLLIKQYTNAVSTLNEAIAVNPTNPFLYLNRSTTRAEMIDFISSLDNSVQRITIDNDPANILKNNKIRTYNYDDAIADLDKVIELFPSFAHTYYNKANLLALSGHLPEAYEEYSHAIKLHPSFAEAYYNRGIVQIMMKDTRKGCLDISKAGELGVSRA